MSSCLTSLVHDIIVLAHFYCTVLHEKGCLWPFLHRKNDGQLRLLTEVSHDPNLNLPPLEGLSSKGCSDLLYSAADLKWVTFNEVSKK